VADLVNGRSVVRADQLTNQHEQGQPGGDDQGHDGHLAAQPSREPAEQHFQAFLHALTDEVKSDRHRDRRPLRRIGVVEEHGDHRVRVVSPPGRRVDPQQEPVAAFERALRVAHARLPLHPKPANPGLGTAPLRRPRSRKPADAAVVSS
jgi:hypothetical protein